MNDAYIAVVCRSVGVPEFWIPDALQDVAIRMWRKGRASKPLIRLWAIDAARKYGPLDRAGAWRQPDPLSPTLTTPDFAPRIDDLLDRRRAFRRVWREATPRQKARFGRSGNAAHVSTYNLRKRMRELAA